MVLSDNNGISSELSKNEWNNDHLHVYLKIKDCLDSYQDLYEIIDSKTIISKASECSNIIRSAKDEVMVKKYTFSKIFGPKTTQLEIFNELVNPKLLDFMKNGHNSSLLTYGVSNSGKTYTIIGTVTEPGVIPRSLEYFFINHPNLAETPTIKPLPSGKVMKLSEKQLERERLLREQILTFDITNASKSENIWCKIQCHLGEDQFVQQENSRNYEVSVWISFAEIYNEHIYDLLRSPCQAKKEKLKLGCSNGETYVKNLNLVYVTSVTEAYQVLQYGLHNLNYAKTNINEHSSRSHSIFTIWLTKGRIDSLEGCRSSHFSFCDLAGAERSKKTLNVGDRLKESNNINTSLLVLGRCMAAVRKMQQSTDHQIAPFRESKLTQLFQKALSGYEDISIIVNINPCHEQFDETQHVLNFSAIAQDIISMPFRNQQLTQLMSAILKPPKKTFEEESNTKLNSEVLDTTGKTLKCDISSTYSWKSEECNKENEMKGKRQKKQGIDCFCSSSQDLVESSCFRIENSCLESSNEESGISASSSYVDDLIVDVLKKKIEQRDNLIAEHHRTISFLRKQIYELTKRVQEMEEKRKRF